MHSPPCIFLFYFVSLMHLFLCSCLFLSRYMFWDVRETQMEGHLVHCLCTPLAHRHNVCFKINTIFVSCVFHICLITLLIFVPLSQLLVSPITTVASLSRLYIFVSVTFLPWQLTFKIWGFAPKKFEPAYMFGSKHVNQGCSNTAFWK